MVAHRVLGVHVCAERDENVHAVRVAAWVFSGAESATSVRPLARPNCSLAHTLELRAALCCWFDASVRVSLTRQEPQESQRSPEVRVVSQEALI